MQIDISSNGVLGGVSQQPANIRKPDQFEEIINGYCNVVDGLTKRPPTQYVARILSGSSSDYDAYMHTVDRGDGNMYTLVVTTGGITAFNQTGGSINVINDVGNFNYLTGSTPAEDFKVITVQDYTFVVNKDRTPAMSTGRTASATYGTEGYVFIKQGNYKQRYKLEAKLTGSTATSTFIETWDGTNATAAAAAGELQSLQTNQIATGLLGKVTGAFTGNGVAGNWFSYSGPEGSVFQFTRTQNDLDYMRPTDGVGDTTLSVIYSETISDNTETNTERTRQLPQICRNGFKLSVLGEAASEADDYYIEFIGDTATGLSRGYWRETIAHNVKYAIDPVTMPHQLVLEPTGSTYQFRFQTVDWDDRAVGDETSNPDPSFIGRPIQDIFFFQDRLGLVAEDRIVMSEQGEYFNFFRSTLKSLPDTERIDAQVSHNRVVNLNHAVPYNKSLLLFSDLGQFLVPGDEAVTNKTISVVAVSEYETSDLSKPGLAGRSVYMPYDNGNFAGVREFYQTDLDQFEANEITNGVPQYVAGRIVHMAVNTLDNLMAILCDESQQTLYIYKYLWNGNQKVLSSWGKWKFGQPAVAPSIKVYHMAWVDSELFMLIKRKDGIYLEKMVLAPGFTDDDSEFVTLLDRRLDETGVSISYSAANNQTTVTLPYQMNSLTEMRVIGKDGKRWEVQEFSGGGYGIVVRGNLTGVEFWVGETYTMTVTATPPVVKVKSEGGYIPVAPSAQKARKCHVYFKDSRYLKITSQVDNRSTYTYYFTGPSVNDPNAILGEVPTSDGKLSATIMGTSDKVAVNIINDSPYPSNITNIIWVLEYKPRSSRFE